MFAQFQWIDSIKIVKWGEKKQKVGINCNNDFFKREFMDIRKLVHNRTDAQWSIKFQVLRKHRYWRIRKSGCIFQTIWRTDPYCQLYKKVHRFKKSPPANTYNSKTQIQCQQSTVFVKEGELPGCYLMRTKKTWRGTRRNRKLQIFSYEYYPLSETRGKKKRPKNRSWP